MENFKKKFIEEAAENIQLLEEALLDIEQNKGSAELIEQIFRAMHSLKGGGAMFGFDKISQFTHDLETIYDHIRSGSYKLTDEVLEITFDAVDHLKLLIDEEAQDAAVLASKHESILLAIRAVIAGMEDHSNNKKTKEQVAQATQENDNIKTWYIYFKPNADVFANGTNPLYIVDELCSLGESRAVAYLNNMPTIHELEPETCYTYWEIILSSEVDENTLNDVFIFVEDDCQLDIQLISPENLLDDIVFANYITQQEEIEGDIGIDNIKAFLSVKNERERIDSGVKKGDPVKQKNKQANGNAISSIRVASEKLDSLMNLVSELVTTQARLNLFAENDGNAELLQISENIQKLTRQLREIAFDIVLIPIDSIVTRFQRLVRDLSKDMGKNIDFVTEGTDTELDKNIIDSLTDPIMHIIRNSLDHGIEDAATRVKSGKSEKGKITLKAFHSGASVHVQIIDDGRGIDTEIIRKKAINKGLITEETHLSKKELYDFIFMPGFSTATTVTDVSGRGVGMDVVKRKIADLRGEVDISSEIEIGTILTVKLPITLSIIDGLLVEIGATHYIIPLVAVQKIYAISHDQVEGVFDHTVILDGEKMPFYHLKNEFKIDDDRQKIEQVVVVQYDTKKVALVVDNVIGEYQAVLKSLGKHYRSQDMVSGASILGDGTVALVLDTNKMITALSTKQSKQLQ